MKREVIITLILFFITSGINSQVYRNGHYIFIRCQTLLLNHTMPPCLYISWLKTQMNLIASTMRLSTTSASEPSNSQHQHMVSTERRVKYCMTLNFRDTRISQICPLRPFWTLGTAILLHRKCSQLSTSF